MKENLRKMGDFIFIILVLFGVVSATLLWPILILIPIFLLELAREVVIVLTEIAAGILK